MRRSAAWWASPPAQEVIGIFLALTVVDASLVVVTPLLVKRIIDDGILKQNSTLVTVLALAVAGVAIFNALLTLGQGYLPRGSARA